MNTKTLLALLYKLSLLGGLLWALWGCARYADDVETPPTITARLEGSPVFAPVIQATAKEQSRIQIAVTFNTESPIQVIRVIDQNNAEVTRFTGLNGNAGTFTWSYFIPANTPSGSVIQLRHVAFDSDDRNSEAVFTVNVADISAPVVSVNLPGSTDAFATVARNLAVTIDAHLEAPEGLRELRVSASGAGITPTQDILPAANLTLPLTTYGYVVPAEANINENITLEFVLADNLGKLSAPAIFTITVEDVVVIVSGNLTGNNTWTANKIYQLNGPVYLSNGASLTIEAGTQIQGTKGTNDELIIEGQIDIQGSATAPVRMSSGEAIPSQGDWVGITFTATSSGSVRYLVVAYAGDDSPLTERDAAFNFLETTTALDIQFVQAYQSSAEGFRFRGGNVNLKYAFANACSAEGFRLDDNNGSPYNGKGQFWIVTGNNDAESIALRDGSFALLSNITILNEGAAAANNALRIRGGSVRIFNVIAAFNSTGLRFLSNAVPPFNLSDNPVMAHGRYFDNISNYHSTTTAYDGQLNNSTESVSGIGVGDFVPLAAPAGLSTSMLDPWFTNVSFIGAVENESANWTAGWTLP
ncbi:MAG: hypothetical protein HC913_04600 [Microscillaceae bacterium]|nr:hypothetical protein [Microscillaceae bacterium]